MDYLWLVVFAILFLLPLTQRSLTAARRYFLIKELERSRNSRVITIIHRQELIRFLGIPVYRYLTIDDAEEVLRAIRMTPTNTPIDLILHTPGGLVLAAEQIIGALKQHKGRKTVFITNYAMSGGTLVSLAADSIVMSQYATLGPTDPQIGIGLEVYPAASVLNAIKEPNPHREDKILILADLSRKAIDQLYDTVFSLLKDKMTVERASEVAKTLTSGKWTHDYPLNVACLRELGLSIDTNVPEGVYELMRLYKRPALGGIDFIPEPKAPISSKWDVKL